MELDIGHATVSEICQKMGCESCPLHKHSHIIPISPDLYDEIITKKSNEIHFDKVDLVSDIIKGETGINSIFIEFILYAQANGQVIDFAALHKKYKIW